ncbi:putative aldouronate transport system permease protein [Paenibacillus sp. UNC496MF]|uniref:ABC transporter permease n=1 Tax=Paenibacillus sp. UNC496MF TaxID=1502753 RepID=UPI0008E4C1F8|nr:ABC transporter permease subunit [Paenibacillus sp. UNC496MF]SFJ76413.1 putative aldouronate transport system permease protein [Paenibacillus sp. UNC496MF]
MRGGNGKLKLRIRQDIPLYIMILPGFLYFIIFKYIPMGGLIIAFQNYDPFEGFLHSPWVGLDNFHQLFAEQDFMKLLSNTLVLSSINLFLFFPAPIVFTLLLNEIRVRWFGRLVQTVTYMPHFVSWVVVVGMMVIFFSTQDGMFNNYLENHGMKRVELLTDPVYFRWVYLLQNIWKETGWSAIIFIAALASVDPSLYEAAVMDGASRWRQMLHVSLPALKSTIVVLFILRLGHVMDIGFEHIFLMQNSLNLGVSDVFDTFVYRIGIQSAEFSYSTAVGLFKSLVGLILIIVFNALSKKIGEEGVY